METPNPLTAFAARSRLFPFSLAVLLFALLGTGVQAARKTPSAPAPTIETYAPDANAPRADVPAWAQWDLSVLWKDDDAWEKGRDAVEAALPNIAACAGKLGVDAATLRTCLDLKYDTQRALERLWVFASAHFSTDRGVSAAQARLDRIKLLGTAFDSATAFIEPELLGLAPGRLEAFLAAEPGLAVYGHILRDILRRKAHVLSPAAEAVLALSGDLRGGPYAMLNALQQDVTFPTIRDEEGKPVELAFSNFSRYRGSSNRLVRKWAVEEFFGTLAKHKRSFAASLDMGVKRDVFVARARQYESALAASLDADHVPVEVFNLLLDTTAESLPRTLHRYVALRKRVMGLSDIHYYDLYAPLVPDTKQRMRYDEATALIDISLVPLGDDYRKALRSGMDLRSGWTDVFPNRGKRSGAYQTDVYGYHPFVFLNYMDELDDAFTTAHEFGHAMHSVLANAAQAYPNAAPTIFLAEIASTFNEELLLHHLLGKAEGRAEKLALLNKRLENIRTTVFRQIMFAEFERDIHAEVEGGGALTAERTSEIYRKLVEKYYGPEFKVCENDDIEWAYVPHFYYNFYVYKYATGLMSAIALSRRVLKGEEGAVDRYLDLLRAGGSDYPLVLLDRAGVGFQSPETMRQTFDLFDETITEFEALL